MADSAHCVLSSRVEKGGAVAVHCNAGCPGGQSRKNVLARGEGCAKSRSESATPLLCLARYPRTRLIFGHGSKSFSSHPTQKLSGGGPRCIQNAPPAVRWSDLLGPMVLGF